MMNGFYGRMLVVDLTLEKSHIEPIKSSVLKTYLGGKGLGAYLLNKLNPKGILLPIRQGFFFA